MHQSKDYHQHFQNMLSIHRNGSHFLNGLLRVLSKLTFSQTFYKFDSKFSPTFIKRPPLEFENWPLNDDGLLNRGTI